VPIAFSYVIFCILTLINVKPPYIYNSSNYTSGDDCLQVKILHAANCGKYAGVKNCKIVIQVYSIF